MFLDQTIIGGLQKGLLEDCYALLPELILCGTLILLLLLRLFPSLDNWHLGLETLILTAVALAAAILQWYSQNGPPSLTSESPYADFPRDLFGGHASGLLRYDNFTLFFRMFLIGFTLLTIILSMLTGIPDREDAADFYTLLLGASIGMLLMAMANHLLMVFIAVEMASLPSFALAGFLKGKRQSSEAALKYVVYGGGASGIMLYGISLLAGKFGTGYLPDLGQVVPAAMFANASDPILLLGFLFIFIGLAFKLSVVPFHFWCPDVFEGAAAEVAGFLSVASKGAALALTGRLALVLVGPVQLPEAFQDALGRLLTANYTTPLATVMIYSLAFFAAITATFGNLAAYPQTNLKRLLAYSTIAHAGYMVMGLATLRSAGVSAVLFYLVVYLLMNLGAFACVAFLRNQTGSEDLSSFRGLIYRSPVLVITFAFFLLSLLGLPPLAGFAAKFQIFQVLYESAQLHGRDAAFWLLRSGEPGIPDDLYRIYAARAASETNLSYALFGLLVVGGLNTVFSVVYYLKVMKVMVLDKPLDEVEGREPQPFALPAGSALYASVLAAAVLVVGILWNPLVVASNRGVEHFNRSEDGAVAPVARASPCPKLPKRSVSMNDVKLHAVLQDRLARESRSLLQFVGESFPWTRFDDQAQLTQLQKMIADERQAAVGLSSFMRRKRIALANLGPYPLGYASLLFVSLDYLLPQLVEHQRQAVEALQRDLEEVQQPEARQPLEHLLHVKQWHLTKLQEMAAHRSKAPHAAAASS